MLNLTYEGLKNAAAWGEAEVELPGYDPVKMADETLREPTWVHFGAGNIFRGYIAGLANALLNEGLISRGIIAAESYDTDIIKDIYAPHDNLALLVTLRSNGALEKSVISSIAAGYAADTDFTELVSIFQKSSLQMVSFTITEKGYATRTMEGGQLPSVTEAIAKGPKNPTHIIACITSLLLERYKAGAYPISLVSMDNCSNNGDRLAEAVLEIAGAWCKAGLAQDGFMEYLSDRTRVAFPLSMIDKITPRPAESVAKILENSAICAMKPMQTGKGTYIAPFVNAEAAQYLVIEDAFPNGRPPLERAGVYLTTRETVGMVERMKVTTCLNPLHTALAVYGCLLGYDSIAAQMRDEQLLALVRRIGYDEGLPVVTDPGILSPRAFLDEVVNERLPNPFIPDTPQRIATDTSQKMAIRFGETIKAYMENPTLSPTTLTGIPLAVAGWLRYLLGVDDDLAPMPVSPDPLLTQLQESLKGITPGNPETARDKLTPILRNASLFGVDLYTAGIAAHIEQLFTRMLAGKGAVRTTLRENL